MLKPDIFAAITEFYSAGEGVFGVVEVDGAAGIMACKGGSSAITELYTAGGWVGSGCGAVVVVSGGGVEGWEVRGGYPLGCTLNCTMKSATGLNEPHCSFNCTILSTARSSVAAGDAVLRAHLLCTC